MSLRIGSIINRYWVVTLLPSFVGYVIYADYSHTQRYKAKLNQENVKNYS